VFVSLQKLSGEHQKIMFYLYEEKLPVIPLLPSFTCGLPSLT